MPASFENVYRAAEEGLTPKDIQDMVLESAKHLKGVSRVLLIPPDFTRAHSRAGELTALYYALFAGWGAEVDILPALGTHMPMTDAQIAAMFPGVPRQRFFVHDWREGVRTLGEVPGALIHTLSEGKLSYGIKVQLASRIVEGGYGLILNLGQVVPHEVAGMSSHLKNMFVGCGGSEMIDYSHFLGAVYGAERVMGEADTPVRAVWDHAWQHFTPDLPVAYALTVIGKHQGGDVMKGLFLGQGRECFVKAARLSQQVNINRVSKPIQKAVVYLDPEEYHTTWLGNKAVYRTRMALAPGAQLLILAPGVRRFGEDLENDGLIREFGYCGREQVLKLVAEQPRLSSHLSAAAHLIHGSSDGKFTITYATRDMPAREIEGAGYLHMPYAQAEGRYNPRQMRDGFQTMPDGEEVFFIRNPGLGLWKYAEPPAIQNSLERMGI